MSNIGIYIHIPFCKGKCPYCDFYSVNCDYDLETVYKNSVMKCINDHQQIKADTLYIGGGTPSCINPKSLTDIITTAINRFNFDDSAEITVECNPSNDLQSLLPMLADAGVNRISMGLQSAVPQERKSLGRKAKPEDVQSAIKIAHKVGIDNISLDLMLGVPNQTQESLKQSIDFCTKSGATHISAYILKIEENTHFYKIKDKLNLPDEDETASLYLYACEQLEDAGFAQYEISNFANQGRESRHNLKYWNCEEYLGMGASAHSFLNGRRFYYDRDINSFINNPISVQDGIGGDFEEYVMMRLRLVQGLQNELVQQRFDYAIPENMQNRARELEKHGFTICDEKGIRLTRKGFLLSNSVIVDLLSNN
ncbi:MAG: radical SAM family heme chaperone HemW [Clostridia bacterium]|nr:radical SAM family heme chaperone HemW [Clostridia bacterium]